MRNVAVNQGKPLQIQGWFAAQQVQPGAKTPIPEGCCGQEDLVKDTRRHPSGLSSGSRGKHAVGAGEAAAFGQEEGESDFSILSTRESVPPFFELIGLAHFFRVSSAFALPFGRQFNAQSRSSSDTGFPFWIASSLTSLTSWRMSRPDK